VRYTRAELETLRTAARRVEKREGLTLAAVSVSLGLAQLGAIAWMDRHLERMMRLTLESGIFLGYFALVVWLLLRMQRRIRAARPTCPQCRQAWSETSERAAMATGRCDACGGQVLSAHNVEFPAEPPRTPSRPSGPAHRT
jgi:hypothetical protein